MGKRDKASPNDCQLIDAKQLAGLLCLSVRRIWRLYAAGELPPAIRIGRTVRWKLSDIRQWIDEKNDMAHAIGILIDADALFELRIANLIAVHASVTVSGRVGFMGRTPDARHEADAPVRAGESFPLFLRGGR